MTNATLSPLGAINGAVPTNDSEAIARFRDLFSGEVIAAYAEHNKMDGLHRERTIEHGKSASFALTGKATARYHVKGTPVLGSNNIPLTDVVINVDGVLLSDVFIADIDDAMLHHEVRQEFSKQLGVALAREYESKLQRLGILAARASANIAGGNGGSRLINLAAATDGNVLASMIFDGQQVWDEKDVYEEDRHCLVKPAQYYMLVQTDRVTDRDHGGDGSYAEGVVKLIGGVGLVKTNRVPTGIYGAVTGERNDYTGDFTNTVALMLQKRALGTVKLLDTTTQMTAPDGDFAAMYQGTLMLGKNAMGHGILEPACANEIATA